MQILGLVFAGTATEHRAGMTRFLAEVLVLPRVEVPGVEADLFRLADGSHVAVAAPGGMGDTQRSIGFLVDDLDDAVATLERAGTHTDGIAVNGHERYTHFRAPDGELYELLERLDDAERQR